MFKQNSNGITDNDDLNLFSIEGELFAASESCHIHNFKKDTLATGDRVRGSLDYEIMRYFNSCMNFLAVRLIQNLRSSHGMFPSLEGLERRSLQHSY